MKKCLLERRRRPWLPASVRLCLVSLAAVAIGASAFAVDDLFMNHSAEKSNPTFPILRETTADVDTSLLDDCRTGTVTRIALNLFIDSSEEMVIDEVVQRSTTDFTLVGHLARNEDLGACLTVYSGAMAAWVATGEDDYHQILGPDTGAHTIQKVDVSALVGDTAQAVSNGGCMWPAAPPVASDEDYAGTHTVDIMVVYTQRFRDNLLCDFLVRAAVHNCIDTANRVFNRSNSNVRLNLVHLAQVSYDEKGANDDPSLSTALTHLVVSGDGQLETVHTLRDQYKADLVTLFVGYTLFDLLGSSTGANFGMSTGFSGWGSVLMTPLPATIFAHEIGHNFGCGGDADRGDAPGVASYALPKRYSSILSTIMGYGPINKLRFSNEGNTRNARVVNLTSRMLSQYKLSGNEAAAPEINAFEVHEPGEGCGGRQVAVRIDDEGNLYSYAANIATNLNYTVSPSIEYRNFLVEKNGSGQKLLVMRRHNASGVWWFSIPGTLYQQATFGETFPCDVLRIKNSYDETVAVLTSEAFTNSTIEPVAPYTVPAGSLIIKGEALFGRVADYAP